MNETDPTLSIIIPSFNTAALTRNCLQSILAQPGRTTNEIIVVDNGSRDGTVELVGREFPQVTVIAEPVNCGYGMACNIGAGHAHGEFLLFLNSDTQMLDGALDSVSEAFRREPSPAAVACREVDVDGRTAWSCFGRQTLRAAISFLTGYRLFRRDGDRYRMADWDRQSDRWVDNVSGFAWAVRRTTFEQLGGFDAHLFLYCEEQDFGIRLQQISGRILFCADARIIHLSGRSSIEIGRWGRRRQWVESFVYLRRKHRLSRSASLDRIVLYPFLLMWWLGSATGLGSRRHLVDPQA